MVRAVGERSLRITLAAVVVLVWWLQRRRLLEDETDRRRIESSARSERFKMRMNAMRVVDVDRVGALERDLAAARDEIERLKALSAELPASSPVDGPASSPVDADDLTVIKGIGPAVERALHAAGVTSLAKLAALDADSLDDLAAKLPVSRARMERDDWIGSAGRLLAERGSHRA